MAYWRDWAQKIDNAVARAMADGAKPGRPIRSAQGRPKKLVVSAAKPANLKLVKCANSKK